MLLHGYRIYIALPLALTLYLNRLNLRLTIARNNWLSVSGNFARTNAKPLKCNADLAGTCIECRHEDSCRPDRYTKLSRILGKEPSIKVPLKIDCLFIFNTI